LLHQCSFPLLAFPLTALPASIASIAHSHLRDIPDPWQILALRAELSTRLV
jgi:hypothetical protein